jgi:uncharacterized repeat protein (TIGR03803 family)
MKRYSFPSICAAVMMLTHFVHAQTFTSLYSFKVLSDGGYPTGAVVSDQAGNIYGTTYIGGEQGCGEDGYGCGVVYRVDSAGTETVLHTFADVPDGNMPEAPVARDGAGNLYGTTSLGGSGCGDKGCGAVFKIDPTGNETVLYSFTVGAGGCSPSQSVVMDSSGNLYGTTYDCGAYGAGTIFKVDSSGKFSLLHSFNRFDGSHPAYGHLTLDKSGNLYGVTWEGGSNDGGVLYKLNRKGQLTLMHSFGGSTDGCAPYGTVAQDDAGNLYGTTEGCGSNNLGAIWKVSKTGRETILHNFAGSPSDGCNPYSGVTRDSKGNLYGVTYSCGAYGPGALYKLSATRRLTLLHSFAGSDGQYPVSEVSRTVAGTLLGTTYIGGTYDAGTVWSYVP